MRKNGWQLPYHPLQVVAVAVFLALGFAFYVFFAPFVGKKLYQYVVMGLYTPLILCAFSLYICCAAADPADPGVFKSRKYLKIPENKKHSLPIESKLDGDSTSSIRNANAATISQKHMNKGVDTTTEVHAIEIEANDTLSRNSSSLMVLVGLFPCASLCKCSSSREEFSEEKTSEDGMFYCSLCEVEVFKYSKHCRVCDKCVDRFDHHCRWLNNCIGKKNYRKFFTLMVSALLLLILQWSTGILVLIRCLVERKSFYLDIASKLGSSFTEAPFVIVVAMCTILAMIATLPLVQLFFFHILLVKKGISTYDYIIALREQDQQGQQSSQMSPASSLTGLSSTSSFNTYHRGGAAWCTPPRLFLEDQFDVVPPDTGSVSSLGKRTVGEEPIKKKKPPPVKISPWALSRLNGDEVSKAAAEARKKSKIMQPVARQGSLFGLETKHSFGRTGNQPIPRLDSTKKRNDMITETSTSLGSLQHETGSAFRTANTVSSSESSLDSPDQDPFGASLSGLPANTVGEQQGIASSRSTSDGYEASGGEDSDRVPSRFVQRSTSWSNHLFSPDQEERPARSKASASFSEAYN